MIKQRHLHYLMQDLSNRKHSVLYPAGNRTPTAPSQTQTYPWLDSPRPQKHLADVRSDDKESFDKAG